MIREEQEFQWRRLWMAGQAQSINKVVDLTFSPDNKHVAYAASKGAFSWEVVVDGQAGAEYSAIAKGSPSFSRDSKHVAYAAKIGNKFYLFVDGHAVAVYDAILDGTLMFDSDGVLRCLAVKQAELYRFEYVPKS